MNIRLNKAQLAKHLRVMERIVPKRSGLPFYYVVHTHTSVDGITCMWVTNGKESYAAWLTHEGQRFEDGEVAIPASELFAVVAVAPESWIEIVHEGGRVVRLISGTARWNVDLLAGVEATEWEGLLGDTTATKVEDLMEAIDGVRYSASRTEMHPSLQQVHVGEGRVVAADGRRVAQKEFPAVGTFDIPERAVETLLDALRASGAEEVGVSADEEGEMRFVSLGSNEYRLGRLSYPFPDIDGIALTRARAQKGIVVTSVSALVSAIKVAQVSAGDDGSVELTFTNGVIDVTGISQRSNGRMEVRCTNPDVISGTHLRVSASDLLEVLGRADTEDGDITFTVTTDDDGDPGWVYFHAGGMEAAIRPMN